MSTIRRYVAASHPLPTAAVTLFVLGLGLTIALPLPTLALIGLATLAGQLSIGWSNDLIDARRDAQAGRTDKPLSDGRGSRGIVVATTLALATCVVLSLAVGALAAACHLVGVACGWAYNAGLKATVWSWLPYAAAFALLPTWVYAAQEGAPWAPLWMTAAAGLLGVSAHLVNAAPDVAHDRAQGVQGLPQRWGAPTSITIAMGLLVGAAVVGLLGPAGTPSRGAWLVLAGLVAVAVAAMFAVRRADRAGMAIPRWTFAAMLALVAVVVATVLTQAASG